MTLDIGEAAATGLQPEYERFRQELIDAGLLVPTSVDGVYGKSATYERIVDAVRCSVSRLGGGRFPALHFPPVLARPTFDLTGYLGSFPDLMGSVHVFNGDDKRHRELIRRYESGADWMEILDPADIVLCSAACHAVYPLCRGQLPEEGRRFDIWGHCFRHEPSRDPARMQSFRMHELVFVGEPDSALEHRNWGLARGIEMLEGLHLSMETVPANDPFFGRIGTMMANTQLDEALKIEGVTPICSSEQPTAIMSANYAQDHFGVPFEITTAGGDVAHSSCVAFGVDRITLALLRSHGLDPSDWPAQARSRLWP